VFTQWACRTCQSAVYRCIIGHLDTIDAVRLVQSSDAVAAPGRVSLRRGCLRRSPVCARMATARRHVPPGCIALRCDNCSLQCRSSCELWGPRLLAPKQHARMQARRCVATDAIPCTAILYMQHTPVISYPVHAAHTRDQRTLGPHECVRSTLYGMHSRATALSSQWPSLHTHPS
jgi:hypothetical protein